MISLALAWLAISFALGGLYMLIANGRHHQRQTTHRSKQNGGEVGGVGLGVSHLGKGL